MYGSVAPRATTPPLLHVAREWHHEKDKERKIILGQLLTVWGFSATSNHRVLSYAIQID
mgnify:FL=1